MILYVFRNHYTAHVTAVMFQKGLYVLGSTLLLIVPGIIKHYEYYMVPYILAENPTMTCRRAMELSSKMTEGQKMDMLKMDLSFWFWEQPEFSVLGSYPYFIPCRTKNLQKQSFIMSCVRICWRIRYVTTESCRDLKRIWVYKKGKRVNCRIFYAFFRKSYVFGKKNSGFLKAAVLYF